MHHGYLDKYSHRGSFLNSLNAEIKIIGFLAIIVCVVLTPQYSFSALFLYTALIGIIAFSSRMPLSFLLKESLGALPFALVIALALPFFKEGKVIFHFSAGILKIDITRSGVNLFGFVVFKAYLSILAMILLVGSTQFNLFLRGLQNLKVPALFIMILSFMYRYIFVILDELMRMSQAKRSRAPKMKVFPNFKVLSSMLGSLFIRSYEKSEKVYLAMCSRGFDGEVKALNRFSFSRKDFVFLTGVFVYLAAVEFMVFL